MAVDSAVAGSRARAGSRAGVLRFRDLGPLGVDRDGTPLALGGRRLISALTLLLVHADRVVSTDALADAMWGPSTGPRSPSTLDSHIWRLRNLLEPWRARGEPASVLLRETTGYRLVVAPDQVDSLRFAVLADETLGLLTDGQAQRAVHRAEQALALWRGRPFTALADEPWAQPVVARLEELHDQVRERHVEALLAVGDPERALVELATAIGDAPLRERLWVQRMLAHQRSGRTDQALASYVEARRLFLDEIGIEPGAELRALQARILDGDPSLAASRPEPARAPDRPAAEVHLPTRLPRLIGRDGERDRLAALTRTHRLVTVVGTAGCGKTRLAVDVARAAADGFPDGVWLVDLTAAPTGAQVVTTVTSALGLAPPATGSARDALRSFGRERRMLLLLDNCEHVLDAVAGVVGELLDHGAELAVLATSREPLEVDGEVVWPLDPLALPEQGSGDPDEDVRTAPAVELFLERVAVRDRRGRTAYGGVDGQVDGQFDDVVVAQAVRICRAVDGVPLAIELAAARARAYSLDEIAVQVSADASALSSVGRGAAEHHRTVRFAVEQSYRTLDGEEARLHRALSVIPGPFTAAVAAALVERPVAEVRATLARLVHRSLLKPRGPLEPGRPSRFVQLAIVRGHAAHVAATETDALVAARDRWVGGLTTGKPRLGSMVEVDWFTALDEDLAAVRATLQHTLVDAPAPLGVAVTSRLNRYWYYRGMVLEARQWQDRALAQDGAAALDRAILRTAVGGSLCMANRSDLGVALVHEGWALLRADGDGDALRTADGLGALAETLYLAIHSVLGLTNAVLLHDLAGHTQDPATRLLARMSAVLATSYSSPPSVAVDRAAAVYEQAVAVGNWFVARSAAQAAADAALAGRDVESGMLWSDRLIAQYRERRIRESPSLLEVRADLLTVAGDMPGAVRLYSAARAHNQRAGMRWPLRKVTAELLERATGALDRVAFEEAWRDGAHLRLDDLDVIR